MYNNVTITKTTSKLLNQLDEKRRKRSFSNVTDENEYDLDHLKSYTINENESAALFKKKIQNSQKSCVTCKICLNKFFSNGDSSAAETDSNGLYELEDCKCKFCLTCLNQYIYQCIENCDVLPIYCPDSRCATKGVVQQSEIKFLIGDNSRIALDSNNNVNESANATSIGFIDSENENLITANSDYPTRTQRHETLFKRYLKLHENIEILRDPNRRHCPMPGCQSVCTLTADPINRMVKVTCEMCKHHFCSNCSKKWTTPENRLKIENFPNENVKSDFGECSPRGEDFCKCSDKTDGGTEYVDSLENFENIKRCPKCGVLIERADGCAQIMCKVCKHTFCFYCLASLDNDFLLKHFTKNGPCKGKLGHSKLSLFMHRLGVVAIFSGTVFLVIILSPIILLSLPCLIFSNKCRKTCLKFSTKFS